MFGVRLAKKSQAEDFVSAFKALACEVHNLMIGGSFALDAKVAGPKQGDNGRGP